MQLKENMPRYVSDTRPVGLTFHDQCAIAAMQGIAPVVNKSANDASVAAWAFDIADAMLAERERRAKSRKEGE